jgi:ectoine hydroxylase-related dioxygenase (phytanoyl-CoA dioxygenase family)
VVAEIIQSEALKEILSDLYPSAPMFVTHSKISLKFPESKQIWLPHQDIVYKKDKELQGASICIFLEDIDPQNGALTLHRGSHKNGPLEHKITFIEDETEPQIECDTSEEQERVQITGHKGDVCVFDLRTIHESGINKGSGRRAMLIFDVLEIGKDGFLEENGKDAIAYNVGDLQNHLLPRILTFTRNILIVPIAKRALYGLHKLGIRNLKM